MRENSWLGEELTASQEGPCSVELVNVGVIGICYHTKFSTYSNSSIKLSQAVKLQTSMREVPDSNLHRNTDYSA